MKSVRLRLALALVTLALATLVAPACTNEEGNGLPSPEPTVKVKVSVRVFDAENLAPLTNVQVKASGPGGDVFPGVTALPDDTLQFELDEGGTYRVTFWHDGYLPTTYHDVAAGYRHRPTHLERVLLIPLANDAPGDVSGTITNALSGLPEPDVQLRLRVGINAKSGGTVANTTTDSSGNYAFSGVEADNYTAEVSKVGFITDHFNLVAVGGQHRGDQSHAIAPVGAADEMRIVLTWGAEPRDLDAHLTGDFEGAFHVYFSAPRYSKTWGVVAELDVDNTSGFGPETITMHASHDASFAYCVHDYSNRHESPSTHLANSNATVRVYLGPALQASFHVPSGPGTLWRVFEVVEGSTNVIPLNRLSHHSNAASVDCH